jgi:hypothetical protein
MEPLVALVAGDPGDFLSARPKGFAETLVLAHTRAAARLAVLRE